MSHSDSITGRITGYNYQGQCGVKDSMAVLRHS